MHVAALSVKKKQNQGIKGVHMNQKITIRHFKVLLAVQMIFNAAGLVTGDPIVVQKITTPTLEKERILFEKFIDSFCSVCVQQSVAPKVVGEAFKDEEQAFAQEDPATLFFHALHEEDVVGYISCDLLPGYQVRIRQLAVDPLMFDAVLVKELLFAIFASVPKVRTVTLCCPTACLELATLFEDLGFVLSTSQNQSSIQLYAIYELKIHPKCKICEVLYANSWDTEDDGDSNWDDSVGSVDDEFGEDAEMRALSSTVEEEQNNIS